MSAAFPASGSGAPPPVAAGTPRAASVLAPNPSPMTLDGTNTWILAEPAAARVAVVDPGPADRAHLQRVLAAATAGGRRVDVVLLTHGHPDHAQGAAEFAGLAGAPVRALDPAARLGDEGLRDGDVVEVAGLEVRVLATPGHSGDSLCFLLPADRAVLTGDTVLGRGTTVVAHPDGRLSSYLDSLRRLRRLAGALPVAALLPGHGPSLFEPAAVLDHYLAHREERLEQIRGALALGLCEVGEIVEHVYADVDRVLWPAAGLSVRAQLDYLAQGGDTG